MHHIDLFSGIGGFSLAADRVFGDVEHIFVENDEFCQQVLKKHWPEAEIHGDIRTFAYPKYDGRNGTKNSQSGGERADNHQERENQVCQSQRGYSVWSNAELLTGGFPCQPFSQAGRRRGTADDRYLWPEMFRVIQEFKPQWVIAENVRGLVTWSEGLVLEQVCTDLESEGYEVQPLIIPAVAVNAPHRRDRVWIIAHSISSPVRGEPENLERKKRQDKNRPKISREFGYATNGQGSWNQNWIEVATRLCRVDDGLPRRLDRNPRLKALGNAIVPQVAEEIMKAIKEQV